MTRCQMPFADRSPHGVLKDCEIYCQLCGALADISKVEVTCPDLPNTLTKLPDHNNPVWKCPKCGAWSEP